jgi:hypothetical protein
LSGLSTADFGGTEQWGNGAIGELRLGGSVIWWHWDNEGNSWQPAILGRNAPFSVGDAAEVVPVPGTRHWALLAHHGAKVNGLPCLPIEVLADRDEVHIEREHYCFSAQAPPEVVTFDGRKAVRCARCLGRLAGGDQVVRCSGCLAHHHASCWTYHVRCQKCESPTDGRLWVPDVLN